jgi:mannosyltransferase
MIPQKFFQILSLVAVLVLAAILRLHGLGAQSLWRDESNTRMMAYFHHPHFFEMQAPGENLPPPYFVILKAWMKVFGLSETSMRMPSALCGIAAVFFMYLFGRRLVPDRSSGFLVGLFAALLLCISRFHIAYSQEARPYSMAFLLAVISCYALAILLHTRQTWAQWLYFVTTAGMFWLHPYMLLVFFSQCVFIGFCAASKTLQTSGISIRRWLTLIVAVGLCCSPWVDTGNILAHGGQAWMPKPDLHEIAASLVGNPLVCGIFAALAVCALIYAITHKESGPILGILIAILPVAIPVLLSQGRHSLFVTRYGIGSLIGICLTAAYGAALLGRYAGSLAILTLCLILWPPIWKDFETGMNAQIKPDLRDTAGQIERLARPHDAVYCPWDWLDLALTDYLRNFNVSRIDHVPAPNSPDASNYARIWLVLSRNSDSRTKEETVVSQVIGQSPYQLKEMWFYSGVTLSELTRKNPPTTAP